MINKIRLLTTLAATLCLSGLAHADDIEEQRAMAIVSAFNSMPEEIAAPLTREQVHLHGGEGRVDVNVKAKFSYFAQTPNPEKLESEVLLIPMATSRYAPSYYQTDEWWDAHQAEIAAAKANHRLPPQQDEDEVAAWLKKMKLSTNPFVLKLNPATGEVVRTRLQVYLADLIVQNFARNGMLTVYRGAERADEFSYWSRGERPKGVRYWTPSIDYAWRYGRKNLNFVDEMVKGRTPLFAFKIPVAEFKQLAVGDFPDLVLGTELTKNAHAAFERSGRFLDHLYQSDYLGAGPIGVEIEMRGNRQGSNAMTRYFAGAVSAQDLALGRERLLKEAESRLVAQYPLRASEIHEELESRRQRTHVEGLTFAAIRENQPREIITQLMSQLPAGTPEISNIDGFYLQSFVEDLLQQLPSDPSAKLNIDQLDRELAMSAKP